MPSAFLLLRRHSTLSSKPKHSSSKRLSRHWLRHPEKQNALLRQIIDRVRNSLELKVVLQTATDEVAALLNLDRCYFFWYFHDTQRIQVVCESLGSPALSASRLESKLGYYSLDLFGAVAAAIARGELVVHHGEMPGPLPLRWFRHWLTSLSRTEARSNSAILGATANLLVPVNLRETSIGFIACLADCPRYWSAAEVEFIQLAAQQLEIAISQAQLYEKTQKQAQRERLINQITAQTRQSLELKVILNQAIAHLLEALEVDRCLVHLVEDPNDPMHHQPSEGLLSEADSQFNFRSKHLYEVCRSPFPATANDFDTNGPITHWVIQNRRRVVISDVTQDGRIGPNNAEYRQAEIKSSLVIPVQNRDTLYAILYLNQCSHVRYWSKDDQKLAQAVADQLAISIHQAHLYAQTRQQAVESAAQAKHLSETLRELRLTQSQLIQSEKMSSLGRIVAGVAHEINNPINFIYGNIPHIDAYVQDLLTLLWDYKKRIPHPDPELQQLLDETDLDFLIADLPRILSSMRSGADRIRQIVLSLRNFSRLDEAEQKTVDIHDGIESSLLMLQTYLDDDIQIVRQYGQIPAVECYPGELNQVFMNILMNAADALQNWQAENKAIAICTDYIPAADDQPEMVRVVITDNGPGIPHEVQSQIFDPFFTTKEVGQGTGLGLTVSYQTIVNQHRGKLKFYSEPGLGAEFMIEIPVHHTPTTKPAPELQLSRSV